MTPVQRAQWQIHFCVVLWGFTAILGKLITLPALPLVLWRMALTCAGLAFIPAVWRGLREMHPRDALIFAGIGVVVALHWITFYAAIKASNASVAATCMALGSVFAAVVEPFIARRKFSWRELILGVLVLPGMWILLGGIPLYMQYGVMIGVVSAALTAVFSALNKRYIGEHSAMSVTAIEMASGSLIVFVLIALMDINAITIPSPADSIWLIILALACTLLPFALSLRALRHISAFQTQLALNLEPVYAIILAAILLGEQSELSLRFYLGAGILCLIVIAGPALIEKFTPSREKSR
jgi:drug/metabolite transporter (DMT)-like permease